MKTKLIIPHFVISRFVCSYFRCNISWRKTSSSSSENEIQLEFIAPLQKSVLQTCEKAHTKKGNIFLMHCLHLGYRWPNWLLQWLPMLSIKETPGFKLQWQQTPAQAREAFPTVAAQFLKKELLHWESYDHILTAINGVNVLSVTANTTVRAAFTTYLSVSHRLWLLMM